MLRIDDEGAEGIDGVELDADTSAWNAPSAPITITAENVRRIQCSFFAGLKAPTYLFLVNSTSSVIVTWSPTTAPPPSRTRL
jgi:hypothetical protein